MECGRIKRKIIIYEIWGHTYDTDTAKYIVETAETGTISRAAEKLYISQPSLTAAIRELEHEFGITIFQRTNKGIILTSEGEEFLGYARQVITLTSLMEERYSGAAPVRHQF